MNSCLFFFFLPSIFPSISSCCFTFSLFLPLFGLGVWHSLLFLLFVSPPHPGFSAECQTKIGTLIPAVRPSSRRNPPARPPWRTASTTTAQVVLPTPAGATAQPWMAIRTDLTRRLSTLRLLSSEAVGLSGNCMMTAPAPSLKIPRPSVNTCSTRCPRDCV